MGLPRVHVDGNITEGKLLRLPEAAGHHLARVLRKSVDDDIVIFNGTGGEFVCRIESIRKDHVEVTPVRYDGLNRAPGLELSLGLCILKKDSMDSVLAKVVELGVRRITPLISDHCSVAHKVIRNREPHWQQIVIAACEQCGLNLVPNLDAATPLRDWLQTSESDIRLIAVPGGNPLKHSGTDIKSVSLLTGPEGGFSDAEEKASQAAGFNSVTFGERVLRAETAPVVALTVAHQLWGNFSVTG